MMINDTIYLLDELFEKLAEIHKIETEMKDIQQWLSQNQDTRQEREQLLNQDINFVKTFCLLTNETLSLFEFFSEFVKEPFMKADMVDRIAQMLNYFLYHLKGPKSLDLRINDAQKLHWEPDYLLGLLVKIYLHFASEPVFLEAVVKDGRSFNLGVFQKTVSYLKNKKYLVSEKEVAQFDEFKMECEQLASALDKEEEDLGEIPDDFLDPLTALLMEDPVILPTSGKTVDRSTITRSLLSIEQDPFNRAKLTIDMVKPNIALKNQIEEWKQKQRESKNKKESKEEITE